MPRPSRPGPLVGFEDPRYASAEALVAAMAGAATAKRGTPRQILVPVDVVTPENP